MDIQSTRADPERAAASDICRIAEVASQISLETLPPEVVRQAKLCVLDAIGCMVAGSTSPGAAALREAERRANGPGEASVVGSKDKLSIEAAARVNAYMGDVFEHNDLLSGHAGIANVAAMLALAEHTRSSGAAMLEAIITGIEVTSAVYLGFWDGFTSYVKPLKEVAITPPSIPNSIGVAAAAARLTGMDARRTAHAMAIAGSLAGWCPAEAVFQAGGTGKPLLFGGWPASVGLRAMSYAGAGMTGPLRLLESDVGFYSTVSRPGHPAPRIGAPWRLEAPRRKLHACCGYIHSAFDSLVSMRHDGVPLAQAAEIRISIPPAMVVSISKPELPTESLETVFHGEYSFALGALEVDVIEPEHSTNFQQFVSRPDVQAMFRKIRIFGDPRLTHSLQSRVEVVDPDGKVIRSAESHSPRGAADNPLTDEEVRDKFRRQVRGRISPKAMETFIVDVDRLDTKGTTEWLIAAFA